MKSAVVIGSKGQDGRLLYALLRTRGYAVVGIDRDSIESHLTPWRDPVDICRYESVERLVREVRPAEIYHVAAVHHSSQENSIEDLRLIRTSYEVNYFSLVHFLEAVRLHSPATKVFYAASSHIFGNPETPIQDENTPLSPNSIYGITKSDGLLTCRLYREKFGIFASTGILYNHESQYRSADFLSKKIILGALNILKKKQECLVLGDLGATIDWGFAPDFVDAMVRILELNHGSEFVIATGKAHTVKDFVEVAFALVGLDYLKYVKEDSRVISRKGPVRVGSPAKLIHETGWTPRIDFREMIGLLLQAEGFITGSVNPSFSEKTD